MEKTNLKVLDEVSESQKFIKALEKRRVKFVGYLLRDKEFVTNIIEGEVLGQRGRGSPILRMFDI